MDWIYVICPAVGMFIGWLYGIMLNSRYAIVRISGANWVPGYLVMGALWGLSAAGAYRSFRKKGKKKKANSSPKQKLIKRKMRNRKRKTIGKSKRKPSFFFYEYRTDL